MPLVAIAADDVHEYHGPLVPSYARVYADRDFRSSDGVYIRQGSPTKDSGFSQRIDASMNGDFIRLDTASIYSTTDALFNADVGYTIVVYTASGKRIATVYADRLLKVPPSPSSTNWAAIQIFSRTLPAKYAPTFYDTVTLEARLALMGNAAFVANEITRGVLKTSVPPATGNPIAVETTDPRVNRINAGLYASFALAVDAAIAAGLPLYITTTISSTTTKAVTCDVIVENKGKLNVSAGTLTFSGKFKAGPWQVFNITGSGAVVISAAIIEVAYTEWYGITSGGDNSVAMQRLFTARKSVPTAVWFLAGTVYSFASPLSLDDSRGMNLVGVGGYASYPELRYTGSGASSAITAKSSQGLNVIGLAGTYTSATFTGHFLELGHSGVGGDVGGFVMERCYFSGAGGTAINAASLVTLESSIVSSIKNCYFDNAKIGLQGFVAAGYANSVTIENNVFGNLGKKIVQTGQAWNIRGNTFEPNTSTFAGGILPGENRVIDHNGQFSYSLVFEGNWIGDGTSTTSTYACFNLFGVIGGSFSGGNFCSGAGSTSGYTTAFRLDGCEGISISGDDYVGWDRFITYINAPNRGVHVSGCNIATATALPVTASGGVSMEAFFGNDGLPNRLSSGLSVTGELAASNASGVDLGYKTSLGGANSSIQLAVMDAATGFTNGSAALIAPYAGGAERAFYICTFTGTTPTRRVEIASGGVVLEDVPLLFRTNNTIDIGAAGAYKPRTGYFGTSVIAPVGTFATSITIGGGTALTTTNATGTGNLVKDNTPTLITPVLGVATATSLAIGGGTAITKVLKGSVTIDPASVAANTVADQTFTLTGAATGDVVQLNPPTAGLTAGLLAVNAWISAADTLKIRFQNTTGSPIDAASATWFYKLTR